jgi:hypothetical protein
MLKVVDILDGYRLIRTISCGGFPSRIRLLPICRPCLASGCSPPLFVRGQGFLHPAELRLGEPVGKKLVGFKTENACDFLECLQFEILPAAPFNFLIIFVGDPRHLRERLLSQSMALSQFLEALREELQSFVWKR